MKFIAALEVDFDRGALGTQSRQRAEILGETVLRRTLRRMLAARRLASVHLVVPKAQESLARQASEGLSVRVETHNAADVPWREHVASARKWAMDAWRGGIGGMSVFDEGINPWILAALGRREGADVVAVVPAASPLLDPGLLDAMIAHYEKVHDEVRMVFTQAAPGLAPTLYLVELLEDLAKVAQPPGRAMAYVPSEPKRDMVMQPCYYSPEVAIAQATGRCIADTSESMTRIENILKEAGDDVPDARTVSLLLARHKYIASKLPAEVEIELTTDDLLPHSTLRPRGAALQRRAAMEPALFNRLITELAGRDDIRVVLGGFGDPLLHPQWMECVAACRQAGIFGLAIRTPAIALDERSAEVLIENRVDLLNVLLDATTSATYQRLHRAGHFDVVLANLDRLLARRQEAGRSVPLVLCEMMKTRETMGEMEEFYDHWVSRTGSAVLAGPSDYSGRWADLSVIRMTPPTRFACQRVFGRTMILANGLVLACDQDFRGEYAVGSLAQHSLGELWTAPAMEAVRAAQAGGRFDSLPICARCEEWHRP